MLSRLFNRIGLTAFHVAPGVQEAAAASLIHYGPMALRLAL